MTTNIVHVGISTHTAQRRVGCVKESKWRMEISTTGDATKAKKYHTNTVTNAYPMMKMKTV